MITPIALDHVALYVQDVDRSIDFYQNVLGWEILPRPAFDFPGAWFHLGGGQQLHLLGGRSESLNLDVMGSRRNHFAVKVLDCEGVASFLSSKNLVFKGPRPRPDGVLQLFLQDPDGYWIEFNE
ncbi:MAG: VOC family protein [Cytophagaceae bacterium]|nr:VOC family protein [Cytophagaceae bacterium]